VVGTVRVDGGQTAFRPQPGVGTPLQQDQEKVKARLMIGQALREMRWLSALALLGACALIIGPPQLFTGHAHWQKVVWVPFSDVLRYRLDVGLNFLLFFPFGFLFAYEGSKSRSACIGAVMLVAVLSSCGEFYQVFCHYRFPTTTDILCNTGGAAFGLWARFFRLSRALKRPAC
jgi:hypothetical protein